MRALIHLTAILGLILATPAGADELPTVRTTYQTSSSKSSERGLEVILDSGLYAQLRPHSVLRLTEFPVSDSESLDLRLTRTFVTTPDTRIVLVTDAGEVLARHPTILTFRGEVEGRPDSEVVLTVTPEGVKGLIDVIDERYLVSSFERAAATRIVPGSAVPQTEPWPQCEVNTPSAPAIVTHDLSKKAVFRICRVALECDYEYWTKFTNLGDALTDIYTVFNAINAFYEDDLSVRMILPFIRIWQTSSDPYSYVGGAATGLDEFKNYWKANHNPGQPAFVERDLAHLMSGRGVGAWAEVGYLCDYNMGFSISGGNQAGTGLALDHDIYFVGHELGHNFNAIHTHCFNPPLDHCVIGCNSTYQDCNDAPGTIMSYCHACASYDTAFLHEFAPENISRIRTEIDSSCLVAGLATVYVDWTNTGYEDGTLLSPFDTVLEGARAVLPDGTVWIDTGNYAENITLWQSAVFGAYAGKVTIGQ